MLQIRDAQLAVFVDQLAAKFTARLVDYLRGHHPAPAGALGDDGLAALVKEGLASARRHGFSSEYDCARWIEILLVHGAGFGTTAQTEWAAEILSDLTTPPADRMARLESWLEADERWRARAAAQATATQGAPPHA